MAPRAVLTITLAENGDVRVDGPITDKMLCYAMMENARDAIKDFADAQRPKLATPTAGDILTLNGRRG